MRYIGSKAASVRMIETALPVLSRDHGSFCDPFAGTCTVSRHFKRNGYQIFTGDILNLSYAFQVAHIEANRRPAFAKVLGHLCSLAKDKQQTGLHRILNHLNDLPGLEGLITREYSPAGSMQRNFFSTSNALKIDAIRTAIANWNRCGWLSHREFHYLLACLLQAADKVANTAGTYYAYLKTLYRKALQPIQLQPLPVYSNSQSNKAHLLDAHSLVEQVEVDVLYLDPPYNRRDYSAYYHLPETLVVWDSPEVRGKSGMRNRTSAHSPFCHRASAADALRELIRAAHSQYILLHYTTHGLIAHGDIMQILQSRGTVSLFDWTVRKYANDAKLFGPEKVRQRLYVCNVRGRAHPVSDRATRTHDR